uniref:Uncharacterized protein n=1 Tax=Aegilops tauschii subsp. strangulata TaxID=200361 RepID=A0A453NIZ7_AEGTS
SPYSFRVSFLSFRHPLSCSDAVAPRCGLARVSSAAGGAHRGQIYRLSSDWRRRRTSSGLLRRLRVWVLIGQCVHLIEVRGGSQLGILGVRVDREAAVPSARLRSSFSTALAPFLHFISCFKRIFFAPTACICSSDMRLLFACLCTVLVGVECMLDYRHVCCLLACPPFW